MQTSYTAPVLEPGYRPIDSHVIWGRYTILSIDYANRMVTIETGNGDVVTIPFVELV